MQVHTGLSILWPMHQPLSGRYTPVGIRQLTYLTFLIIQILQSMSTICFHYTIIASNPFKPNDKYASVKCACSVPLRWRHNGPDSVSNHQPHDCLLNRLFRRRSKKISKLRVTGLCVGNSSGPVNSPHKGPVTRKMFPFDDVIMPNHHLYSYWPLVINWSPGN